MIKTERLRLDCQHACETALRFLHRRCCFDLWLVTQRIDGSFMVVASHGQLAGEKPGDELSWVESIGDQVAAADGPVVVARNGPGSVDPAADPDPSAGPAGSAVSSPTIGAYLGIPLRLPDGSLNGTLCALHPTAVPETVAADLPLIEMVSELLGSALSAESALARVQRRAERAEGEAMTDALTGLFNRRGWDQLLATEESRCQRFAHPACVLSVDLDALKAINDRFGHAVGDQLIRKTGDVLRAATRQQDVVARVGGDEFAVLGVECANPKALAHGVQAALLEAGIEASVGYAARHPLKGLVRAQREADQTMYRRKRARRRGRSGSPTSLSSAAAAPGGWMLRVS